MINQLLFDLIVIIYHIIIFNHAPLINAPLKATEVLALDSGAMVLSNAGYQTIVYHTDTN